MALVNNQAIRESIEDQMGILSLISVKSGASVFGSASTEEQVTDGVDAAGLTVLITVRRCGRPATDGKMLMWRQACLIHGDTPQLPPEAMMDFWWDGTTKKRLYQYSKYVSSIAALSFSKDGHLLAVASSYGYEEGEKLHEPDSIFIPGVNEVEVKTRF